VFLHLPHALLCVTLKIHRRTGCRGWQASLLNSVLILMMDLFLYIIYTILFRRVQIPKQHPLKSLSLYVLTLIAFRGSLKGFHEIRYYEIVEDVVQPLQFLLKPYRHKDDRHIL
jgi:hypothetical protein